MRPIFVTGTDTGVGKTFVTTALLRALRLRGHQPFPIKLVETGCADLRAPEDGIALAVAAGRLPDLDRVCPYRYQLAASPWTAARAVGQTLSQEALFAAVESVRTANSPLVLEGAGGWRVPLNPTATFADVAVGLDCAVVVVARDALGTLNHTLLTVESIQRCGLPVVAVVLNAVDTVPSPLDHAGDLRILLSGIRVLGPLRRVVEAHGDHRESVEAMDALGLTDAVCTAAGWDGMADGPGGHSRVGTGPAS